MNHYQAYKRRREGSVKEEGVPKPFSRNAVPVSQNATETATETYPKSNDTEIGGANRYETWTMRKVPAGQMSLCA